MDHSSELLREPFSFSSANIFERRLSADMSQHFSTTPLALLHDAAWHLETEPGRHETCPKSNMQMNHTDMRLWKEDLRHGLVQVERKMLARKPVHHDLGPQSMSSSAGNTTPANRNLFSRQWLKSQDPPPNWGSGSFSRRFIPATD